MNKISENILEQTTLNRFESLGWQTASGPDISPDDLEITDFRIRAARKRKGMLLCPKTKK
jgi:hypothetical protein